MWHCQGFPPVTHLGVFGYGLERREWLTNPASVPFGSNDAIPSPRMRWKVVAAEKRKTSGRPRLPAFSKLSKRHLNLDLHPSLIG